MTTRAVQIELLLSGLIDPTTGNPLVSGTVYFYAAGTSNAKNVWTEKEKTNAFTSITLDTIGQKQIYGEGIYKLIIKNSAGDTIYTWDNMKFMANNFYVRPVSANTTATTDDDVILMDTSGGNRTITCAPAADMTHPLIAKNIGTNNMVIDPNASETIDGDANFTAPTENMIVYIFSDGTNLYKGITSQTKIEDTDGDTLIQTEESADEDKVRIDVGGAEAFILDSNGLRLPIQPAFLVGLSGQQANVGEGSTVTILFDTEVFDIGSNFDVGTYKFTAPVTGKYQLNMSLYIVDIDTVAAQLYAQIKTSNRDYENRITPDHAFATDGTFTFTLSTLADMDATDTAYVVIHQTGGAAQMDISVGSYFSGYLVM